MLKGQNFLAGLAPSFRLKNQKLAPPCIRKIITDASKTICASTNTDNETGPKVDRKTIFI